MGRAAHPGGLGDQLTGGEADVDVAPAPLAATVVVPRRHRPAPPAPAPLPGLGPHTDIEAGPGAVVELEAADDHGVAETEHLPQ